MNDLKNQVISLQSTKRERRAREERRRYDNRRKLSSSSSSHSRSSHTLRNKKDAPPPPPSSPPASSSPALLPQSSTGPETTSPPTSSPLTLPDEFARRLMEQMGLMLSTRLEALEDRLLPAKLMQPPLGQKAQMPSPSPTSEPPSATSKNGPRSIGWRTASVVPSDGTHADTQRARNKSSKTQRTSPPTPALDNAITTLTPPANTWTEVVRRGRKKKGGKGTTLTPTPQSLQDQRHPPRVLPDPRTSGSAIQPKPARRRRSNRGKATASTSSPSLPKAKSTKTPKPPKSAAIVLTRCGGCGPHLC